MRRSVGTVLKYNILFNALLSDALHCLHGVKAKHTNEYEICSTIHELIYRKEW